MLFYFLMFLVFRLHELENDCEYLKQEREANEELLKRKQVRNAMESKQKSMRERKQKMDHSTLQ